MGDNLLSKVGERRMYSAGDKPPKSTRDKLPESTGEDDSTLLGNFWTGLGEGLRWGVWYSVEEQSYLKTAGDVCLGTSVYSTGEC